MIDKLTYFGAEFETEWDVSTCFYRSWSPLRSKLILLSFFYAWSHEPYISIIYYVHSCAIDLVSSEQLNGHHSLYMNRMENPADTVWYIFSQEQGMPTQYIQIIITNDHG